MSSKNISKCLKIHKRITAADFRTQEIIADFDDRFGSRHTLASVQSLDILVTRTYVSGNDAVSRSLLLWCLEHFNNDVQRGTVSFDAAKPAFNLAISRSLLKKRIINYVNKKVPMPAKPKGSDPANIPTIESIFGSFQKFRNSGLDHGSTLVMTWRASMPCYLQETFDFLTKLTRGGGALDESLDIFLSSLSPKRFPGFSRTGLEGCDYEGSLRLGGCFGGGQTSCRRSSSTDATAARCPSFPHAGAGIDHGSAGTA